ncbi:hypothetical protein EDS67_21925 [candidate division KSB1 bacterium]|nr:MAG: hypothetical protein EDS67_21925 [candidate division KSB1 bacterium]
MLAPLIALIYTLLYSAKLNLILASPKFAQSCVSSKQFISFYLFATLLMEYEISVQTANARQ